MSASKKAVEAAARAEHADGVAYGKKMVTDDYDFGPAEFMRHQLMERAQRAADAMHDPALGLDRSVCLRDVVEFLAKRPGLASARVEAEFGRRS